MNRIAICVFLWLMMGLGLALHIRHHQNHDGMAKEQRIRLGDGFLFAVFWPIILAIYLIDELKAKPK